MGVLKAVCFAFAALSMIGSAFAQAPTDYSKVEIKTDKIAPNFYVLNGSGGAIGVLAGPDGVLMVERAAIAQPQARVRSRPSRSIDASTAWSSAASRSPCTRPRWVR